MPDNSKKRSNFVGTENRVDIKKYVRDLDRDVQNLFIEKSINLRAARRYAYTVSASYSQ